MNNWLVWELSCLQCGVLADSTIDWVRDVASNVVVVAAVEAERDG